MKRFYAVSLGLLTLWNALCYQVNAAETPAPTLSQQFLKAADIPMGLCVFSGLRDSGVLAAEVAETGKFLIHQLETDDRYVKAAQDAFHAKGVYGAAFAELRTASAPLPYTENLVNSVIVNNNNGDSVPIDEIIRIMRPLGAAFLRTGADSLTLERQLNRLGIVDVRHVDLGGEWLCFTKPWPTAMDEWNHPRHGVNNNAVSTDQFVGPPRRIRWIAGSLGVMPDMVSAQGHNYYGDVIARDSFNGLLLWDKKIGQGFGFHKTHQFRPGSVRPVANGDRLYIVDRGLLQAVDGGTGKVLQTYPEAGYPVGVYCVDGTRLVVVNEGTVRVLGVKTGEQQWLRHTPQMNCLTIGDGAVFLSEGNSRRGEPRVALRLNLQTGQQEWERRTPVLLEGGWLPGDLEWLSKAGWCTYYQGVLIFEVSTFSDFPEGMGIYAMDAKDGKMLWKHEFIPFGHFKQARALMINDRVYITTGTNYSKSLCKALDLRTGKLIEQFKTIPHHCFPPVATQTYLLSGEMTLTDLKTLKADTNRITKSACGRYAGVIPANGLIYTTPKGCVCFPMLNGFNALAPAKAGNPPKETDSHADFVLEKGLSKIKEGERGAEPTADEWPCYRHDAWRSSSTTTSVPTNIRTLWTASLGAWPNTHISKEWKENSYVRGPVSGPVVAYGLVFVARPDAHEIVALDANTGDVRWRFRANGRIDGPPSLTGGLCLFGTRSGWVYCLNVRSGELVWRLRAAINDERIVAFGQVESPWPVPGSVLVDNGTVYFAAGRQYLADGGIRVFAIKSQTGVIRWVNRINDLPDHHYYANSAFEFDSFDLLVRDGPDVAMSRWLLNPDTGKVKADKDRGYIKAVMGKGTSVFAPHGHWSYGPLMGRGEFSSRVTKRPLAVYRGSTLFGCGDLRNTVFRRDFSPEGLETFNTKWYRLVDQIKARNSGGFTSRMQTLADRAAWKTRVFDKDEIGAMVLAGDTLFLAGIKGRLLAFGTNDGKKLAEHDLPAPIWDGMIAAYQRLYITTKDGRILCLGR